MRKIETFPPEKILQAQTILAQSQDQIHAIPLLEEEHLTSTPATYYYLVQCPNSKEKYYVVKKGLTGSSQCFGPILGTFSDNQYKPAEEPFFLKAIPTSDVKNSQELTLISKCTGKVNSYKLEWDLFGEEHTIVTMPILGQKNLREYLAANPNLSTEQRLKLIIQVLQGYARLQKLNIFHGDIKPENILINTANLVASFDAVNENSANNIEYPDPNPTDIKPRAGITELNYVDFGEANKPTRGTRGYNITAFGERPANLASDRYALACTIADILGIDGFNFNDNGNFKNTQVLQTVINNLFDTPTSTTTAALTKNLHAQLESVLTFDYKKYNETIDRQEFPKIEDLLNSFQKLSQNNFSQNLPEKCLKIDNIIKYLNDPQHPEVAHLKNKTSIELKQKYTNNGTLELFKQRLEWLREAIA